MPEPVGFYTDTTICIGCKACQVACHQWNDLPAGHGPDGRMSLPVLSGNSYDNTGSFSDVNWRHVKFIEQFSADPNRTQAAWLMMSDVCKHCVHAPRLGSGLPDPVDPLRPAQPDEAGGAGPRRPAAPARPDQGTPVRRRRQGP